MTPVDPRALEAARAHFQRHADASGRTFLLLDHLPDGPASKGGPCAPYAVAPEDATAWERANGLLVRPLPPRPAARERLYGRIDLERADQEARGWTPERDATLTPLQWLALLARHVGLGAQDGGAVDPAVFERQLVRIGALAVAALEATEANGGPRP